MLPHTILLALLLCCQHLSTAWTTRLPLEVYELTATASASSAADDSSTDTRHRNLEYATVNAKMLQQASATAAATRTSAASASTATQASAAAIATDLHHTTAGAPFAHQHTQQQQQQQQQVKQQSDLQLVIDQRRSRQMLEIIEQQQQREHQHNKYHRESLLQQQQQQQQLKNSKTSSPFAVYEKDNNSYRQRHGVGRVNAQDVRVLYQVGDSEDDLPICAPNAVCSKIDLYETPWIERQCRCPEVNRQPHIVLHHHAHHTTTTTTAAHDKYRSYYERERLLQHKRLLVGDYNDKKFEQMHLKKLMQRLGAVYEEDLNLQPNDYAAASVASHAEDNDALPNSQEDELLSEFSDNEFPHTPSRRNYYSVEPSTAHMRHSGHNGHRAKEPINFIGGCPSGLGVEDGHTIADKTRHYKMCQPVHKLPVCKHFRDYTWTLTTSAELNVTEQIVHCRCPKNSVTYLTKRESATDGASGYTYLFACSPITRIRCQRKQPCKLFTVRKRQEFLDEVNINALCQCPKGHRCPSHHTQSGVIPGESFLEDNIQTYSGYCMAND
ncbi:protein giant-lens [Zeugodacus cucurbitae]|uniref:protein giant-lens n=1 Tax=Zeugodacus cucurbitae TaxID=28588 RepID=UPI0023D94C6B|nr:protein giant-lens [Zeugodacus cucurbitae]XP_054086147.1 protein giant-lens [Zeugodacus cucurbitae]